MNEFCNHCDMCREHKESRQFYKKINGRWMMLCKECWNAIQSPLISRESLASKEDDTESSEL